MAHKLPATESFADSAIGTLGARWTKPTLYWPCKAWLTGTTDPTGLGHNFVDAKLHDAYKAQTGLVTPFQDPLDASSVGRVAGAYVLRTDQRADVEVRLTHVFQNVIGDGTTVFMTQGNTYAGLGARIHGAAGTDFAAGAGYTEALRAPSGYWFIWGGRAAGGNGFLFFKFLKVVGPAIAGNPSTVTQLATYTKYSGTAENFILPGEPQAMRFTVTTNGAVAELRGFYTPPATGVEEAVLSYDDSTSSGSTFLDAGHSGFWLGTEILDPNEPDPSNSYVMIHGATSFEVRDSADNIVVRDEWLRDGVDEMDTAGPDQAGRTGNVVTGQFTGDQAGASSSPDFVDRLVRHGSSAKLDVDSTPFGGFHLYTDPPSSLYTQSIGGNFTLGSGAGSRTFGLCARMAIGPTANWEVITNGTDKKGYAFAIHDLGSSIFAARIHRYSATNGWKVIASRVLNQSGDTALIAVNTPNAFQFDVENVNGGSASVGTVKLTCSIDSWTLTGWSGFVTGDGISEATDGGVLDAGGDRVLSGTGIGFFAKSTTTDDIYVNSITRPVADVTLDEREQASIFIGGEKVGVTSTAFTVPFEWPLKTLYRDYGTRIRFESMHVHRHAGATNQRRGWKVRSDAAKPAEIATLRTFFADQDGVEKPYPWTLPDGESITAVLEKDSLVVEKTGPNSYGYEFETWETLGPDYPTVTLEDFNIGYIDAAVGGKERTLDPALGGAPLHPVWHFEDSFGAFTLTVNLSAAAPLGGMYVRYELGGTAVEDTHYTVVSGSQSPVFIAEGGTTATFQISTMASGKWYAEKLLTIKLSGTTDGPLDPVENELHVYIRPELYSNSGAPPLPSLQWFATTYSGLTAGSDHTIQIEKLSAADSHEANMAAFVEVVAGGAVEGTDFDFLPNPQIAYGGTTISPSLAVNATRNMIIRSYPSASTKSLQLNLWHDKDDETDKNRYTMTHVMDSESGDNIVKNFPREPADNAYGPVGIIPPKPWDYLVDPTLVDPFGGPVHVFRTREVAGGSGYHRKSFDGQIFCAGHEEGVTAMTAYTRFSMYVRKPTNYELPRFIRFGIRDRGASLAAPQKPTGAIHSQATSNAASTSLTDTATNFTTAGVQTSGWEVNNLTQKWKAKVTGVATNTLTLAAPFTGSGNWVVDDYYTCYEEDGNYSGNPTDGLYDQNYAVHFDTTFTGSGTISYDGANWGVTGAYATTANWNANSEYGIEAETIRDADGVDQNYLRLWIIHNEANADAIGNGQVRIWYPVYFGNGVDGSGEDLTGNKGKALGVFWPMLETSSGALTGAPGRYQPRDGYWWTPNGSAVIPAAGKRSTTLTWS